MCYYEFKTHTLFNRLYIMIKALILDLDNTIYPVASISNEMFEPLFNLLDKHKRAIGEDKLPEIKQLIMKKAWQKVAEQYEFSTELKEAGTELLRNTTFTHKMQTFADYEHVKPLPHDKYLVTMGFTKLQHSKVKMLGLENDFIGILINDPDLTTDTKREVFEEILLNNSYKTNEVLVIGDDPDSEIKAAQAIGIITVLYDRSNDFPDAQVNHRIKSFEELIHVIDQYNN